MRGISRQLHPDIIDFVERKIYEIKTTNFVAAGQLQIEGYYKVAQRIAMRYGSLPWDIHTMNWYPPHVLPLVGGSAPGMRNIVVCTEATDYQRRPGLILYEPRKVDDDEEKKKRLRQAKSYAVGDYDNAFDEFWPTIRGELPRAVRNFDPSNPEYVIIAPEEFYKARYQEWTSRNWDKLRLKPSYDFPGGLAVQSLKDKIVSVEIVVAGVAAIGIVIGASVIIAGGLAVGAAAAGTTISAGGAAGGGEVISLMAYRAAMAAPQVKTLAAAAGVLLVVATVSKANAANSPSVKAAPVRAVAMADFRRAGGTPQASSIPQRPTFGAVGSCIARIPKDFAIGSRVMFDALPYYVVGQFSAL